MKFRFFRWMNLNKQTNKQTTFHMFMVERLENANRNNEENEQSLQRHHQDRDLDGPAHLPFSWSPVVTFLLWKPSCLHISSLCSFPGVGPRNVQNIFYLIARREMQSLRLLHLTTCQGDFGQSLLAGCVSSFMNCLFQPQPLLGAACLL